MNPINEKVITDLASIFELDTLLIRKIVCGYANLCTGWPPEELRKLIRKENK